MDAMILSTITGERVGVLRLTQQETAILDPITGRKQYIVDGLSIGEGEEIVDLTGTAITPADSKVFQHTLAADEVFTIDTSDLPSDRQVNFELHLIQPSTAVSPPTLPAGILWEADGVFSEENDAPDLSTGDTLYVLVFRWDGEDLLGNLAYTKEL